ncbi:MAG: hypothetical protein GC168_09610 [Candidatus Hydrogenedens sp.]|nr:hypothetical protein [Candidatus Hydrogenedens sp.]
MSLEMTNTNHQNHWPHTPMHCFESGATYFITAGTYRKLALFDTDSKRDYLLERLMEEAARFEWRMEAGAVMANHYHFIARAPEDATTLARFIRSVHAKSAVWLNKSEAKPGRKVWQQYWDTCLTYERSYWARLAYVHENPVRHGLVSRAENYRWCSMAWLMQHADSGTLRIIRSFKAERLLVDDNY